jgi:hypothetical protein
LVHEKRALASRQRVAQLALLSVLPTSWMGLVVPRQEERREALRLQGEAETHCCISTILWVYRLGARIPPR